MQRNVKWLQTEMKKRLVLNLKCKIYIDLNHFTMKTIIEDTLTLPFLA